MRATKEWLCRTTWNPELMISKSFVQRRRRAPKGLYDEDRKLFHNASGPEAWALALPDRVPLPSAACRAASFCCWWESVEERNR